MQASGRPRHVWLLFASVPYLVLCLPAQEAAQRQWKPAYEYPYPERLAPAVYQHRRQRVLEHLSERSLLVVFSAEPRLRSGDVFYPYRQNSWMLYLTGAPEPGAVLLLSPRGIELEGKRVREVLFVPERNPRRELWEGAQMGPTEAEHLLGIPALPRVRYDSLLHHLLTQIDTLFLVGIQPSVVQMPLSGQALNVVQHEKQWLRERFPHVVIRQGFPPLTQMRAEKDTAELRLLRRAIAITTEALQELWKAARPGMGEWELVAILESGFRRRGADGPAFPTILASGPNACILHYTSARRRVQEGELLLVDCGAEYAGYAADITRTFPISGRFTPEQRRLYEAVLEAQDSALAACRPGVPFSLPHQKAVSVLLRHLRELGIVRADSELSAYFPHATSHHLGLDVHDPGPRDTLRPGYVITVEPGLYIPPGSPCDQRWWGIGIRIEDDVLITDTGAEVLSASLPRRPDEIEALLRGGSVNKPVKRLWR